MPQADPGSQPASLGTQPDFDSARAYALRRLEHELSPALCYHSVVHTRDDVVVAAERLAALEGVDDAALLLLRTAAYFHDLGFLEQRDQHENAGEHHQHRAEEAHAEIACQCSCEDRHRLNHGVAKRRVKRAAIASIELVMKAGGSMIRPLRMT